MKIIVEATACDLDKEMPAKTYGITVDGETTELDLCSTHGQPIEELIAAAKEKAGKDGPPEEAPAKAPTTPPMQFTPPSPAPRKAAASAEQKPAARKRGGRRPKITSMEEIEAAKARKAQD